jgi:cytosine/adenosine deaminase-related metal-dependent hydrolase
VICYTAAYVLPISAAPIRDGVVAADGGRILYVGPRAGAPPGEQVDLGHSLLMPGLVNAHCHLELTAMRGFLEDIDFPTWISRLIRGKRGVLSYDQMLDAARYGLHEGIRAGVTTYADTCDSGVAFDALREQGVRGIMFQEVFGPDPRQCADSLGGLRAKIATIRPQETPLVRVGVSPHSPYSVSDELFAATAEFARDERLPMAIHIAGA